ncbi:MAG: right-handed parallel beta-helix repeat-containing protein, partial [Phycisphaerales bacterium]|nr:right-handed parallel beta-helix repeat-containing protein [Phycisphaerales bacterium]
MNPNCFRVERHSPGTIAFVSAAACMLAWGIPSVSGDATLMLEPVSATGGSSIAGNQITMQAGQTVTLEVSVSGWGPAILRTYQFEILSAGYTSGTAGSLTPVGWPGTPSTGAFITTGRVDYVFFGVSSISDVSTATLNYRYGATQISPAPYQTDPGTPRYCGTLILNVSPDASGTFTVSFGPEETFLLDGSIPSDIIPFGALTPATIVIGDFGACCPLPAGTCVDALTQAQCDAIIGVFRGNNTTCASISPPCRTIILVDATATGAGDGSSWADAYPNLQDALAVASAGSEIWVAAGAYKPDRGTGIMLGDRTATFQLKNDVTLYGGFNGFETELNERNPTLNTTILSGELSGNDALVACTQTSPDCDSVHGLCENGLCFIFNENSVVTGDGTSATAILDGFTITAGRNGHPLGGGGMRNISGNPTVTNCTFNANWAFAGGGGMSNIQSSPTITNCTFNGNFSQGGGGMVNQNQSSPTIINCTFSGNLANSGGGMMNFDGSNPTLTNCTFSGNSGG